MVQKFVIPVQPCLQLLLYGCMQIMLNKLRLRRHLHVRFTKNHLRVMCGGLQQKVYKVFFLDVTSISHNNINKTIADKLITCVSPHQVLLDKQRTNHTDNDLRQHMAEYHRSLGLCKKSVMLPCAV